MRGACRAHSCMTWSKASGFAAIVVAAVLLATRAQADGALLELEGSAGKAVTAPQSKRFGFGGAAAIAGYYRVVPWFLVGARLRAGALANGDPPSDPGIVDPGTGTFETLSGV